MADQSFNKVKDFIRTHADFFQVSPAEKIEVEVAERPIEVAHRKQLSIFDISWNGLNHASVWLPAFACSGLSLKDALKKAADVTLDESDVLIAGARYQWRFMPVTSNRLVILDVIIKNQQRKNLGSCSLLTKEEELVTANAKIQELEREIEQLRSKIPDQHAHADNICDYIIKKSNVAFVDTKHSICKTFDDVMCCTSDFDICQDKMSDCRKSKNGIDEVIKFCQNSAAEFNDIANNLIRAKAAGAEYVGDTDYSDETDFNFCK